MDIKTNNKVDMQAVRQLLQGAAVVYRYEDEAIVLKYDKLTELPSPTLFDDYFLSLFITAGELDMTVDNKERIGLCAPSHVELMSVHKWEAPKTTGDFSAYLIVLKKQFLLTIIQPLIPHLSKEMRWYIYQPYTAISDEQFKRLWTYFALFLQTFRSEETLPFQRNILQHTYAGFFIELWHIIILSNQSSQVSGHVHSQQMALTFINLMHEYGQEHHDVKWYANELCISANALSTMLKRIYGKTANQLIDEYLVDRAKTLLYDPQYSIQEVAEMLHFSDQSSFGKFFKRHCGISPGGFRKES